jgi:hypothetical protein
VQAGDRFPPNPKIVGARVEVISYSRNYFLKLSPLSSCIRLPHYLFAELTCHLLEIETGIRPVRLAYQSPANNIFVLRQISHQQSTINQQYSLKKIGTGHQSRAKQKKRL